jgi:hypothetical protein
VFAFSCFLSRKSVFGGLVSLLGTGISRIRVALAGAALLTAAAIALCVGFNGEAQNASALTVRAPFRASEPSSLRFRLGQLPLFFEANQGQTDSRVKFLARGSGYGLFLTADQAVLELQGTPQQSSVVTMQLVGAQEQSRVHGADALAGKSNYFVGKDPTKWRRNVPQFARVRYESVYPGIDLVYYGKQGQLEYDFEVAPGADPKQVGLQFTGTEKLKLDDAGNLVLASKGGDVRLEAPRVYQKIGVEKKPVTGKFVLRAANEVGFEIGEYDRSRELVIDPTLSYATFLGGGAAEGCRAVLTAPRSGCPAIAVDAAFNMYVAGTTTSTDFPLSATPYQGTNKGAADVFVTKFDITGSTIVFSTYLGGSGNDSTAGVAVDAATNVYVAGNTASNTDFPTVATNAPQIGPMSANNHSFASELSADGATLIYSTYLGGTGVDTATGLALDFHGKMYLTGTTNSGDFPISATALQPLPKAPSQFFITKLDPMAADPTASLAYSTYLGGATPNTGTVTGGGIAVDASSNVYVTGGTTFTDMGLNSSQSQAGATDAILGKFTLTNAANAQEVYLTYMGGTGDDIGYGVGVDASFNAYITGSTTSTDVTTITALPSGVVPYQAANGGGMDAFVAKFGSICTGTSCTTTNVPFNYFSYLGGSGSDVGLAIAVDQSQGARIAGYTNSTNLVAQNGFQGANGGGFDGLVARIDTTSAISTSSGNFVSYEGGSGDDRSTGIAVDSAGNTYVSGETASGNLPLKNAFQGALKGGSDAFLSKISPTANFTMKVTATPTPVGVGNPVTFTFTVTNVGDLTSGVTFTDTLPAANATFVSATATGGTCGGATGTPVTVVCNLGTMNASAVSTITVILTPTAGPGTISDSATLTVPGSSFTISTSASVTVNDFSISANPTTATVPAGVPANYTLTLTPTGAIPNSIALSCSSGLPSGGTCTFTTTTIPNLNTGAATSTVHVNTVVRPKPAAALEHGSGGPLYATLIPMLGVALMGLGRKRRRVLSAFLVTGFLGLMMLQAGCGSSSTTPPVTGGTPAGTYSVTLTGTSGSVSRTTTVTLVVQ